MATAKKSTKTDRAAPRDTKDLDLRVLAFRISKKQFAELEAFCKKGETTKTDAVISGLVKIGAMKGVAS